MYTRYREFKYGTASCEIFLVKEDEGLVHRVYAKDRRKGHATGLMELVTTWADENGIDLFLRVQAYGHPVQTILSNERLIQFYESFGFARDPRDDGVCKVNIPMSRPRRKNTPYSEREN